MSDNKKHFFLKLNPPRPTFTADMTAEERQVMQQHVAYWAPHVESRTAVVLGPVFDPKGGFGMAVVSVESEERLRELVAKDPANAISQYEIYPMRAVYK